MNDMGLILYGCLEAYGPLQSILEQSQAEVPNQDAIYKAGREILDLSVKYGYHGNIWQSYLTTLLIFDENPFTLAVEKSQKTIGTLEEIAKGDLQQIYVYYHMQLNRLDQMIGYPLFANFYAFEGIEHDSHAYHKNVGDRVEQLQGQLSQAENFQEFYACLKQFYLTYGVGNFGLNRAFRIAEGQDDFAKILPIQSMDGVVLADLVGYELQKKRLVDNTEAFVCGRKANNVLLYGDSGTGKSTSIKAIVNEYYGRGLRMVEIYKHQFHCLSSLISQLKNRNYKFIIYMDDLSFEEFEIEYKYLKAVIEGGVETKPDNILIYATSNRRHLIKETWKDRGETETSMGIHKNDTMEEKLSLANRFGVAINYSKPKKQEFEQIVLELAHRNHIALTDAELLSKANAWELQHGGYSGRTAQQFILDLMGKQVEE